MKPLPSEPIDFLRQKWQPIRTLLSLLLRVNAEVTKVGNNSRSSNIINNRNLAKAFPFIAVTLEEELKTEFCYFIKPFYF